MLFQTLSATIQSKLNILLVGSPGVGKTQLVEQACAAAGANLIYNHPVVDQPEDYKGFPFIIDDGNGNKEAAFLPFGNLKEAINAQSLTVYFMDDLGQAVPAVQAAAMQLLGAHRINGQLLSKHVVFIAATNRKSDKAHVKGILEPVKSRFVSIIEVETDTEDWIRWAVNKASNIPAEIVAFIRFRPEMLNDFKPTSDMTNSPVPRTIENIAKIMNANVPKEAQWELFKGAAGEEFASEFSNFLKMYRELPNPASVLMDPDSATIPTKPDVLYALCAAIARMANDTNVHRFFKFTNKVPPEFAVMTVRDAVNRTPSINITKEFNVWHADHQDVYF